MNLNKIDEISTSKLKRYKERIDEELLLRNAQSMRSSLWRDKIEIIKELNFRIKK